MKHLLSASLLFTASLFLLTAHAPSTVHPESRGEEEDDLFAEHERLDALRKSWGRFHKVLEATKRRLLQEEAELTEAVDAVHAAALRHYPRFLEYLSPRFPAVPLREKIALVLLGHMRHEVAGTLESPRWRFGLQSRAGAIEARSASEGTPVLPSAGSDVVRRVGCAIYAWPGVSPATLAALAEEMAKPVGIRQP